VLVVVVDSATPAITAALVEVGPESVDLVAGRVSVDARAHGELLAPAVRDVLAEAGAKVRDLGAVVAGVGPGPFTGLRVGLATAASLSDPLGIPAYGVCTLDALGLDAFAPDTAAFHAAASHSAASHAAGADEDGTVGPGAHPGAGPILVATDARRKEVYWGVYAGGQRLRGPAVDRPADLDLTGITAAVGDGALRYADVLGLPVYPEPRYPGALALARLAAERIRAGAPAEPLTPLYLRRPDAVEPGTRKPALQ
jgi:tRNA threonylcarbamoyl adenosine modification protein YeaZ